MKKFAIFLISATLLVCNLNLNAQNPFCKWDETKAGKWLNFTHNINLIEGEGCSFRFVLKDPNGSGWNTGAGIIVTVDNIEYGTVTLPWGSGNYKEEVVSLPSGEVQFSWTGPYNMGKVCFEIYCSTNELIYRNPQFLSEGLFFTYQNECCIPLTDFEGEYNQETKQVNLSWVTPTSVDLKGFNIYRNDELLAQIEDTINSYSTHTGGLETGKYKYCVVPVYPFTCSFEEECFEIDIEVGIKNYDSTLSLYPNPATHSITISGDMVVNAKIHNSVGQLILSQHNTNVINVSVLTNGIYILAVETSAGNTIHKKIIINR